MRLIFLDIDGVIATDHTYRLWRGDNCPHTFAGHLGLIDSSILASINAIAVKADAGIVVTSTWRDPAQNAGHSVDDILRAAGLTVPIIGHTPMLPKPEDMWSRLRHRGFEINAYVVANQLPLDSFIVFDDDIGATGAPKDSPVRHGSRVIFTPESTGCGPGHLRRARKLFNLPSTP